MSIFLGSPWTYAQFEGQSATAPGQFSVSEMRELIRRIDRKLIGSQIGKPIQEPILILSMTGFGRSRREGAGYAVSVEMRALNAKQLDISVRIPKNFIEFEELCRKLIAAKIRRGRIDIFVQIESTDIRQKAPHISLELALYYWSQIQEIHREIQHSGEPSLDHLLRIPHIYETPEPSSTPKTSGI